VEGTALREPIRNARVLVDPSHDGHPMAAGEHLIGAVEAATIDAIEN